MIKTGQGVNNAGEKTVAFALPGVRLRAYGPAKQQQPQLALHDSRGVTGCSGQKEKIAFR